MSVRGERSVKVRRMIDTTRFVVGDAGLYYTYNERHTCRLRTAMFFVDWRWGGRFAVAAALYYSFEAHAFTNIWV